MAALSSHKVQLMGIFQLGFNIRGGINEFANIFVSKIYPKTLAYQCGLNEGDQVAVTLTLDCLLDLDPNHLVPFLKLVSVNGVDFRIISHFDAVRMFKENSEFLIVAKYSPYGKIIEPRFHSTTEQEAYFGAFSDFKRVAP